MYTREAFRIASSTPMARAVSDGAVESPPAGAIAIAAKHGCNLCHVCKPPKLGRGYNTITILVCGCHDPARELLQFLDAWHAFLSWA